MTGIEDARQNFLAAIQSEKRGYHRSTEESARELVAHYHKWAPAPRSGPDEIEVFAPTLLRPPHQRRHRLSPVPALETSEWARQVLHICLYADRLWVPIPLKSWRTTGSVPSIRYDRKIS